MVYRFQTTYGEILDKLDLKNIPTRRTAYSLNPGIHEVTDIEKTLDYILPDNVKASVIIEDIRIKFKIKINQTLVFTENPFFF